MKFSIVYEDIAVGAKEAFDPTASGIAEWADPHLLKDDKKLTVWSNPCELYSVALDGSATIMPDTPDGEYAFVSSTLSNAEGVLPSPPVLTMTASEQYASQGIMLVFDAAGNRYSSELSIEWYLDGVLVDKADFYPNIPEYFCQRRVDNYNKIVITFRKINMPSNRLYLTELRFGVTRRFYKNEIVSCEMLQEIDPVSHSISINTLDLILKKKNDIDYLFQAKQPIMAYLDDELTLTTFVKRYDRGNDERTYSISAEDYISILDDAPFWGDIYADKNAAELIDKIFAPLGIPYELDESLKSEKLTGYIKNGTCREALRQIAFALGAVVDTSYSTAVRIYPPDNTVKKTLNNKNTYEGQRTTEEDKLTELRLTAYAYLPTDNLYTAYQASVSGTGTGVVVTFPEPLHSLYIYNGTIIESDANHAVIDASEDCFLRGKKYDITQSVKTIRNPLVLAADKENSKSISDMTLVNAANVDALAQKCYNYYSSRTRINERILADGIKVGDCVIQEYAKRGSVSGRVISMERTISGTANVAEVIIR